MELDGPLAQITNPAYADATSHPKSIRMRRATSRASSPATTSPKPQFSQHAIAETRNVTTTARRGVVANDATDRNAFAHGAARSQRVAGDQYEHHLERERENVEDALVPRAEDLHRAVVRRQEEGQGRRQQRQRDGKDVRIRNRDTRRRERRGLQRGAWTGFARRRFGRPAA